MKYTQDYSYKKRKFGTSFYIIAACCLLILGGASWFALSNYSGDENTSINQESSEYKDNTSSYIESKVEEFTEPVPDVQTKDTAESVSQEPYSSEETQSETKEQTVSFMLPVEGEVVKEYSSSALQYSATYGDMRLHLGVDIACKDGTAVSACGDGTVVAVEESDRLGKTIEIEHGGVTIKYASLDGITLKSGDTVKLGDIIGTVTTVPSECNEESHLHIEALKDGKAVSVLEIINLE